MSDNFLDYSGLTYYHNKVRTLVTTVDNKTNANTSNIESLQSDVTGATSQVAALTTQVNNLQQTVTSGIPSTSYEVDQAPTSGNTTHVVSSNGIFHAVKSRAGYYECSTGGSTAQKSVTAGGYILTSGGNIHIKMTNKNTAANATLNINSTGAYPLYFNGIRVSTDNTWRDGDIIAVYFDGSNYQSTYALNVITGYINTGVTYVFGIADSNGTNVLKVDPSGNTFVNSLVIEGATTESHLTTDNTDLLALKDYQGNKYMTVSHDGELWCKGGISGIEGIEAVQIMTDDNWAFALVDNAKNLLFGVDWSGVFYSSRAKFNEINGVEQ